MVVRMTSRHRPKYDGWIWIIIIGVPMVMLGWAAVLTALEEYPAVFVVLGVGAFTALLLWTVSPRSYDLWPDRIRIVLGWGWGLSIPLDTLAEVRPARRIHAFVYRGLRFAPSMKTPVEIKRTRGMNIVISPEDPGEFIKSVREAQANATD